MGLAFLTADVQMLSSKGAWRWLRPRRNRHREGRHRADGGGSASITRTMTGVEGGYARYIGRVGALAVALGVGMAVATGYGTGLGVAWADESRALMRTHLRPNRLLIRLQTRQADPAPEAGSGSDDSDASGSQGDGVDSDAGMNVNSSGGADTSLNDAGQSTDGPADTKGDDGGDAETVAAAETPGVIAAPVQDARTPAAPAASSSKKQQRQSDAGRVTVKTPRGTVASGQPKAADVGPTPVAVNIAAPAIARVSLTPTGGSGALQKQVTSARVAPAAEKAAPQDAAVGLPGALVDVATTFVGALLSPFVAPGPGAPVEPPLLWAVLAWARREYTRGLDTAAPNVQPQETTLLVGVAPAAARASGPVALAAMAPRKKPPKAVTDVYSATEDTALNVAAKGVLGNDIDTNGDALTAAVETGPTKQALTLNADGSFRYTPNANFSGKDSFTYRASDGIAADLGKVTINVAAVNDMLPPPPPIAIAPAQGPS